MATEDSLVEQGDIASKIVYSGGVPHISGSQAPLNASALASGASGIGNAIAAIRGYTLNAVVTDTSLPLLPADPNRKWLFIQNFDPVGNVYIAFGIDVAVGKGHLLASGGGSILFDYSCPTAYISAIGDIAANNNVIMSVA